MKGLVNRLYDSRVIHRYDDNGYTKYFTYDDFPQLQKKAISFKSGENTLRGWIYSYEGCCNELVILCHGINGGHFSYMTEINLIAKNGYPVLAYDNTGCFSSDGKDIYSIGQSLVDLDNAIKWLKADGLFASYDKVHVIGHSWGGYAAGNIPYYHKDLSHVVDISGFISVTQIIRTFLMVDENFINRHMYKVVYKREKNALPDYFDSDIRTAIDSAPDTKFFIAHSTDDDMVLYRFNTELIVKEGPKPNLKLHIYEDKSHHPHYTKDAAQYLNKTFNDFNAVSKKLKTLEQKKEFFKDTDWVRMTQQDEDFWNEVFEFLKS